MTLWFKVDVGFLSHPKFVQAVHDGGSASVHLWASMMAFCKRHKTGGRLSHVAVNALPGPAQGRWRTRALQALLDAGLVVEASEGYAMHDYAEWNPESSRPEPHRPAVEPEPIQNRSRTDPEQTHDTADPPLVDRVLTNGSGSLTPAVDHHRARARAVPSQSKSKSKSESARRKSAPRWRCVADAFPEWKPTDFHAALARKYGKDLRIEAAKYRDHEFAVPKTDPDRTFNNWLRRQQ